MNFRNIYFKFILLVVLFVPVLASADYEKQGADFFIDPNYGKSDASKIAATLQVNTDSAYFYVDDNWFNSKTETEKNDIRSKLNYLGGEFASNIYPKLTMAYGQEWTPGIDGDRKITVLLYSMKDSVKGYVRNVDEYEKTVNPFSNQREMIYLNADKVSDSLASSYLAHEFTHLIEFNQKERRTGNPEETWLNELRAELAPTIVGYNDTVSENNYLRKRAASFINNPSDSLLGWKGESSDYGTISMFGHYLMDQYGVDILSDSLRVSSKRGIDSINEALSRKGTKDTFADIFTNWSIASYLNDCTYNKRHCYKNENLVSIHVIPFSNFIPYTGESSLSVSQAFANWSANWQKFSGSNKSLVIDFDGRRTTGLKVIYIIRDYSGGYEVKELTLDSLKKGTIQLSNLGTDKASLIMIPLIENRDFVSYGNDFLYSITVSTAAGTADDPADPGNISLPFALDKPLNQMNKEELLMVLIRLIIYLVLQGRLTL
ncbi:MAG: hypothetical protein PHH21_02520 [Candidatus Pacebacteria bacterium]|nr:hypothetical protein [Candidatus Paceibacterota bacterium]